MTEDTSSELEAAPSEHSRRLQADAEIVEFLRRDGFAGPHYDSWEIRLVSDVTVRLAESLRNGSAFADKRARGRRPRMTPRQRDLLKTWHHAEDLAAEMMELTLIAFRQEALVARGWDPSKGATVGQYLYGAALLRLSHAHGRWATKLEHDHVDLTLTGEHGGLGSVMDVDHIEQEQDFKRILEAIPRRYTAVANLYYEGLQAADIARILGTSVEKVSKARQQIKKALIKAGYGPTLGRGGK